MILYTKYVSLFKASKIYFLISHVCYDDDDKIFYIDFIKNMCCQLLINIKN